MASFLSFKTGDGEEIAIVPVLECREVVDYTIPSFSVITVQLRRIKYQCNVDASTVKIIDGFIKNDPSLNSHLYPAEVAISCKNESACLIQISELERGLDVDDLVLIEDVAFVIWKWEWADEHYEHESDAESRTSIEVIPETSPLPSSDDEEVIAVQPEVQHTITFKCMGTTKESRYQSVLEHIAQIHGKETVPCRLKPEPGNPFDAKAISIQCHVKGKWHTIGYVLRDVLDELHAALKGSKVVQVSLAWVKFQLIWKAVGWYAGVDITRYGEWPPNVIRCQSAKVNKR